MKQYWSWYGHQIGWQVEDNVINDSIAIVLIHGFGASKEHWRFNQKVISEIASCYAIDLIGFGDSTKPKSQLVYEKKEPDNFNYCFDNWSKQIIDFCNEVVQKPVVLIGNSIGGVIALNASKILSNKLARLLVTVENLYLLILKYFIYFNLNC